MPSPTPTGPRDVGLLTMRQQRLRLVEQAMMGDGTSLQSEGRCKPKKKQAETARRSPAQVEGTTPAHVSVHPLKSLRIASPFPNAFSTSLKTMNSCLWSHHQRGILAPMEGELKWKCPGHADLLPAGRTERNFHPLTSGQKMTKRLLFRRCVGSRWSVPSISGHLLPGRSRS